MEVGQHCSFSTCKQLDFLPFTCECCGQVFCKDHRTPDSHTCQHQSGSLQKQPASSTSHFFQCSLDSCQRRELVRVTCPHCEKTFCLVHRHQQDHDCAAIRENKAAARQTVQLHGEQVLKRELPAAAAPAKKVLRGARSESTSAKVAFMKMKMRAEGLDSIPQSERVYYEVMLPKEYGLPSKPMFFSKEWSIGRIIDFTAERFRLRNENNKQHAQKLLLFTPEGEPLEMSKPLHALLEVLHSGSSLIMEYEEKL